MPRIGPISRRSFITNLRRLGFDGPYVGRRHMFMVRGPIRLWVPNPHQGDISRALLDQLLRQAGIERDEWEAL